MDKQQKRMVFQYHDNTEINYHIYLFFIEGTKVFLSVLHGQAAKTDGFSIS